MEFYEVLRTRRTVREFEPEPVDRIALERILGGGLRAPSNDHLRSWEFVVVTDKALLQKLLSGISQDITEERTEEILDAWQLDDKSQREMYRYAIPRQHQMLYSAPAVILPFFKQTADLLQPKGLNSLNGFASAWCCVENILLAAAAEGLGACLRIPTAQELQNIQQVLDHPVQYTMPCYIAIGKPKEDTPVLEQVPVEVNDRLHMNGWRYSDEL